MTINPKLIDPTGSGSKGGKVMASYGDGANDTKAEVKATGFFNAYANELARVGSIRLYCSDATFDAKVSISGGVVTLAAMDAFA